MKVLVVTNLYPANKDCDIIDQEKGKK